MKKNKSLLTFLIFLLFSLSASAQDKLLNVYAWSGEIPDFVIQQFEKETGIKVNFSTYENNEVMYAKLRASKNAGYDIIAPSSSFIDRMSKQGMLEPLDKTQLSNIKNISPSFSHPNYDPELKYSVPLLWGATGIILNTDYYQAKNFTKWSDLWNEHYKNQLLMLDDIREVFSIALISLGYSVNDSNPEHIKAAFLKLKTLMQNVKVFSSDTIISILIDEDATLGMAWNGDAYKASLENPHLEFILPKEGFLIWVDNLAIPKNPPHKNAAHAFINFILRPDVAKNIALSSGYPIANAAGQKLLPAAIRNNPMVYPAKETLRHGEFITDVGEEALSVYEKYWEELKMSG